MFVIEASFLRIWWHWKGPLGWWWPWKGPLDWSISSFSSSRSSKASSSSCSCPPLSNTTEWVEGLGWIVVFLHGFIETSSSSKGWSRGVVLDFWHRLVSLSFSRKSTQRTWVPDLYSHHAESALGARHPSTAPPPAHVDRRHPLSIAQGGTRKGLN